MDQIIAEQTTLPQSPHARLFVADLLSLITGQEDLLGLEEIKGVYLSFLSLSCSGYQRGCMSGGRAGNDYFLRLTSA